MSKDIYFLFYSIQYIPISINYLRNFAVFLVNWNKSLHTLVKKGQSVQLSHHI